MTAEPKTRIAVVICSVGRPDILRELMPHLQRQSRAPDRLLLIGHQESDIGFDPAPLFGPETRAEVVLTRKGLCLQRNAGLERISGDCDLVVFFDDDFVPAKDALAGIVAAFARWPEVNGMTGLVLADGILGPGLDDAQARALVAAYEAAPRAAPQILRTGLQSLYGCNMAYRMAAIGPARFDETLPLYAWQEDSDFAARLPGARIRTDAFAGVHRGTKSGRETAGRRLGYSQIANPWYLWRKGSMRGRFAARLALRNLLANHLKMARPEPWIDRRARAAGNWLALRDILRGRSHPGRILEL